MTTTRPALSATEHQPLKASMRRHHFLSLTDTRRPPDSISLLIGAEADQKRRRSTQIPPSPATEMPSRLRSLFNGVVPGEAESPKSESSSKNNTNNSTGENNDAPASPGSLGRVHSYSRLMHAHTKSQLSRPTVGTLPSYQKTMHAFTLNQLNTHRRVSQTRSETSSLHVGARGGLATPPKLQVELTNLMLDEVPRAPGNTPKRDGVVTSRIGDVHGIDFRKLKRRSITDSELVRGIVSSGIDIRDFAAG